MPISKRSGAGRASLMLAAMCLALVPAGRAQNQNGPAPPSKFGPLEKSLFVPGWGQLSEKHALEGALFLAAEIALIAGVAADNALANKNYDLYKKAETMDDAVRYRRLTEKYDIRRNRLMLAAAAVWALNLVDISLIINKKKGGGQRLSLRIEHGGHGQIRVAASCSF